VIEDENQQKKIQVIPKSIFGFHCLSSSKGMSSQGYPFPCHHVCAVDPKHNLFLEQLEFQFT
jgi:hypothetical protein